MTNLLERFSLVGKKALIVCPENPYGGEIARGLAAAGAEIYTAGVGKVELGVAIAGSLRSGLGGLSEDSISL